MDEYNTGMGPDVKIYFKKILKSFAAGILWLLGIVSIGFYFKLVIIKESIRWYNIAYYLVLVSTLVVLLFYYYKLWRRKA